MPTSVQHTFMLADVSPAEALRALSDDAFEVAQQTARSGTLSATVQNVQHEGHVFSYDVHAVEHARGWRGVDTSRTETSVTRVRWDLTQRRSAWSYEGSQARLARVWGSTAIKPGSEQGCVVTATSHIEVRVPLLGAGLERLLINVLARHLEGDFERIARERCAR